MSTLFISESYVKRFTAIGSTVDPDALMPHIMVAQDRNILPIIGTDLYEALVTKIKAGPVTGDYEILLQTYIAPCLAHYAFVEAAYVIRLRFANNSVTLVDSESGQSASIADIRLAVERAEGIAAFYKQRIIDYLCNNSSLFPEYTSNTGADISPTRNNYFQGLNLYETNRRFPAGTFDS